MNGFPYKDASLKRRLQTGKGDTVATKLAYDIHSLVSVIEGGDFCSPELKDVLSLSKKQRSSSVPAPECSIRSSTPIRHNVPLHLDNSPSTLLRSRTKKASPATPQGNYNRPCDCRSEVTLLKDTVSNIQANVLLMQETQHVSEKQRSEQLKCIRTMIVGIKDDITTCCKSVKDCMDGSKESIRDLAGTLGRTVIEFEDRVRTLEYFLDDENIVTIASINTEKVCVNTNTVSDTLVSVEPVNTISSVDHQPERDNNGHAERCITNNEMGKPIPVRITVRDIPQDSVRDDEGFHSQKRKKTRRFCVLGLSRRMNVDVLTNVINNKGPTVSTVRVFPLRQDRSKVMLRINVMADNKADMMLSDGFWPSYLQCKPWRSDRVHTNQPPRLRHTEERYTRRDYSSTRSYENVRGAMYSSTLGNAYHTLSEEVD